MLSKKLLFQYQAGPGPLDDKELDLLRHMFEKETLESAPLGGEGEDAQHISDNNIRRSNIFWLYANLEKKYNCQGLVAKIAGTIEQVNERDFGFELTTFEPPQMTRYESTERGHYDWHIDCNTIVSNIHRKLSWIIQLSNPSEYEGGDLGFTGPEGEPIWVRDQDERILNKGTLITFPSFLPHTITPVTKGIRHSMVGWCQGPRFR